MIKDIKFRISDFGFRAMVLVLTSFLFILAHSTHAQTLDDYLIHAAENNPGLKASYARYQAMAERMNQPSIPDPEIQVGFFPRPMERFMGNQTADFRLMQMFPWFGMISTQKEEANQMAKAQYQLFLEEKNQLFLQVKSTWFEIISLKEEIKLSKENLEYLKKYEYLALIRFQAGTSAGQEEKGMALTIPSARSASAGSSAGMKEMGENPEVSGKTKAPMSSGMKSATMDSYGSGMNAVLQIRIQRRELETSLAQLEANLAPLKIRFNQLINRDLQTEIILPEKLEKPVLSMEKKEFLDSIRQNNPMLAMYDAEIGAYEQQGKMARLEGNPMLGAGVNYMTFAPRPEYGMLMGGENMVMPMVSLTLPVYRKKINSKIRESEFLRESAHQNRQHTESLLSVSWANALRNWEEAERNLLLYEGQIQLVEQQIQLLETSFEGNLSEMEEVLRASQNLLEYRQKRILALNQLHQSLAQLETLAATSFTINP